MKIFDQQNPERNNALACPNFETQDLKSLFWLPESGSEALALRVLETRSQVPSSLRFTTFTG